MASAAQIRANRLNARKSTGPRTPEGKAVVAQNAVKHGLLAQQVVIRGEDPGEFELFRDRMVQDLDPAGSLEGLLAERVAHLGWRLRRAERLENAAWATLEADYVAKTSTLVRTKGMGRPEGPGPDDEEAVLARVVVKDFGNAKVLDRLLGYERRIENSLYRTVGELRRQRLLRRLEEEGQGEVSSAKCEVSSERSQSVEAPRLPACGGVAAALEETPGGLSTNGETEPMGAGGAQEQRGGSALGQGVGRGRPTYEEPPEGDTPNADAFGETKPNEVSSGMFEGASVKQEGRSPDSELQTSSFTFQTSSIASNDATTNAGSESALHTSNSAEGRSCQTKPIGDGEGPSGAGPFSRA